MWIFEPEFLILICYHSKDNKEAQIQWEYSFGRGIILPNFCELIIFIQ